MMRNKFLPHTKYNGSVSCINEISSPLKWHWLFCGSHYITEPLTWHLAQEFVVNFTAQAIHHILHLQCFNCVILIYKSMGLLQLKENYINTWILVTDCSTAHRTRREVNMYLKNTWPETNRTMRPLAQKLKCFYTGTVTWSAVPRVLPHPPSVTD
jgi:hypothetical protein